MNPAPPPPLLGLHHVTALASEPQRTLDFYAGVLGLRLIKRTVNFDDPGTYHFYFGDAVGTPGSVLTFFPYPGARPGRTGPGQVTATALSVRPAALPYWRDRLSAHRVAVNPAAARFGDPVLSFRDPDGLALELVAAWPDDAGDPAAPARFAPWEHAPVPVDCALRGLHGVSAEVTRAEPTVALLTETLGFRLVAEEGARRRFALGPGGPGNVFDLTVSAAPGAQTAAGSVHHVAFRVPDDAAQVAWRERLARLGLGVSPVMDRDYFKSIYFREPGGVLFELATDPPGFTVDEPVAALGGELMLPPWLEPDRPRIEELLPALHLLPPPAPESMAG